MIEKLIVLEDIDPVIFYGVNNANMQLIKAGGDVRRGVQSREEQKRAQRA